MLSRFFDNLFEVFLRQGAADHDSVYVETGGSFHTEVFGFFAVGFDPVLHFVGTHVLLHLGHIHADLLSRIIEKFFAALLQLVLILENVVMILVGFAHILQRGSAIGWKGNGRFL